VHADATFEKEKRFVLGETTFEVHHAGQAHTPGDSFIWLPEQKVMFTGDIVYTERMLGIGEQSNSKSWVEVYQEMAAYNPEFVVPGHGHPTTLDKTNSDTYDYLTFLRRSVSDFIDSGGDISDIRD
jgi:glyoxylase-like metal-dependent hydrolase (beta-lactamase superfamily II)